MSVARAWESLRGALGPRYAVVVVGKLLRVHRHRRYWSRPWRGRRRTDVTSVPEMVAVVPASLDLSAGAARLPLPLRRLAERRYRAHSDTPS